MRPARLLGPRPDLSGNVQRTISAVCRTFSDEVFCSLCALCVHITAGLQPRLKPMSRRGFNASFSIARCPGFCVPGSQIVMACSASKESKPSCVRRGRCSQLEMRTPMIPSLTTWFGAV